MTQKGADIIYIGAEAWNHTFIFVHCLLHISSFVESHNQAIKNHEQKDNLNKTH